MCTIIIVNHTDNFLFIYLASVPKLNSGCSRNLSFAEASSHEELDVEDAVKSSPLRYVKSGQYYSYVQCVLFAYVLKYQLSRWLCPVFVESFEELNAYNQLSLIKTIIK